MVLLYTKSLVSPLHCSGRFPLILITCYILNIPENLYSSTVSKSRPGTPIEKPRLAYLYRRVSYVKLRRDMSTTLPRQLSTITTKKHITSSIYCPSRSGYCPYRFPIISYTTTIDIKSNQHFTNISTRNFSEISPFFTYNTAKQIEHV